MGKGKEGKSARSYCRNYIRRYMTGIRLHVDVASHAVTLKCSTCPFTEYSWSTVGSFGVSRRTEWHTHHSLRLETPCL